MWNIIKLAVMTLFLPLLGLACVSGAGSAVMGEEDIRQLALETHHCISGSKIVKDEMVKAMPGGVGFTYRRTMDIVNDQQMFVEYVASRSYLPEFVRAIAQVKARCAYDGSGGDRDPASVALIAAGAYDCIQRWPEGKAEVEGHVAHLLWQETSDSDYSQRRSLELVNNKALFIAHMSELPGLLPKLLPLYAAYCIIPPQ